MSGNKKKTITGKSQTVPRGKPGVLLQGVFCESVFDRVKKNTEVFVLEGRPQLVAARKTSKQLLKRNVVPTIMSDNMAGFLFYKKMVKEVWIAYHTIDAEGAVCNVGALICAILGKRHKVPVYLFPAGEESAFLGSSDEVVHFNGERIAPKRVRAYVPLLDWVPKGYIRRVYD